MAATLVYYLDSSARKERRYVSTYEAGPPEVNDAFDVDFDCTDLKNVRCTVKAGTAATATFKVRATIHDDSAYVSLASGTSLTDGGSTFKEFADGWIKVRCSISGADDDVEVEFTGDIE